MPLQAGSEAGAKGGSWRNRFWQRGSRLWTKSTRGPARPASIP